MMGWWEAQVFPLSLWLVFLALSNVYGEVQLNKCYCFDSMNLEYKNKLDGIKKKLTFDQYQYRGIKFSSQSVAEACICKDVTRVEAKVIFKDDNVLKESKTKEGRNALIAKIKKQLTEKVQENSKGDKLLDVKLTFKNSESETKEVEYSVEFIWKTKDVTLNLETDAAFDIRKNDDGTNYIPNLWVIKDPVIQSQVLKCESDPEDSPKNGKRDWKGDKLPGTVIEYTCNSGYVYAKAVLAHQTKCQHDLKWTKTNIECVHGCSGDPPRPKALMRMFWDRKDRSVKSKADYKCIEDYRPIKGKDHSSVCKSNKKWTQLPDDYNCERITCPKENIPQVPTHGRIDWDEQIKVKTTITYSCMTGFRPTVKGNLTIVCQSDGKWSELIQNFECKDIRSLLLEGFLDYYDVYDNMPAPDVHKNWWLIVTVPSLAAILAFILCCLCITRTDRFLFVMCGCCLDGKGSARRKRALLRMSNA